MPKLVLIDDNVILREGLAALFAREGDIEVAGHARCPTDALKLLGTNPDVDLILTELLVQQQSVLDFVEDCKARFPRAAVLLLTDVCSPQHVRAALSAGVDGYLLKKSSLETLMQAVRRVAAGGKYFSESVNGLLLEDYRMLVEASALGDRDEQQDSMDLTPREREVLKLVAGGSTNRQIADVLAISIKTVEKHRASFMSKLGLHNAAQVARYAITHELLTTSFES